MGVFLFFLLHIFMAEKGNSNNTLIIINTVILAGVLVFALTGGFNQSDSVTSDDIQQMVEDAVAQNQPEPAAEPAPAPQPQPQPSNAPSADEVEEFLASAYIQWPEDAQVTIIEFSDFQCPFCKRFNDAGTLDAVLEKYPGQVNKVYTHFPLSFHQLAQKAAEGAECVGEQWGVDAFYTYKTNLFGEPQPDRGAILRVAGNIDGIDTGMLEECLDEGRYESTVRASMSFGTRFGVTGTPGSVIFDRATGEFERVSGAVPAEAFDNHLLRMLD